MPKRLEIDGVRRRLWSGRTNGDVLSKSSGRAARGGGVQERCRRRKEGDRCSLDNAWSNQRLCKGQRQLSIESRKFITIAGRRSDLDVPYI